MDEIHNGGNGRCQGTLGLKPWWMSEWQFDPCQCDLPAGHDGPHLCEHVRPDLEAAGETLPAPLVQEAAGNDALLDPASIFGGARVKLWFCPVEAHREVTWDGDVATCVECGRTNVQAGEG